MSKKQNSRPAKKAPKITRAMVQHITESMHFDPLLRGALSANHQTCSGLDWYAGLLVSQALAEGAPLPKVIALLADVAVSLSNTQELREHKALSKAIADLIEGRSDATKEAVLHRVWGMAAWNATDNVGAPIAAVLKAAGWYSMIRGDNDPSICEAEAAQAARTIVREGFDDKEEIVAKLEAGLNALGASRAA